MNAHGFDFLIEIATGVPINKEADGRLVVESLRPTRVDFSRFEKHLMAGLPYSFNVCQRTSGKRLASGFQSASFIAMDSDKNASLAEILNPLNPLSRHIRYIAPSPSDTAKHRKLRVIFQLDAPIHDATALRHVQHLIYDQFLLYGVRFDKACVGDAARWYYAKEVNQIADFTLDAISVPSNDYTGILRLPNCEPLTLSLLTEYNGELEARSFSPTTQTTKKETLADLFEQELRRAGVLLERTDSPTDTVFCRFKLKFCHTSLEHKQKDNNRGAYSNANLTIWNDGSLTYHCYGESCKKKSVHSFLRNFNVQSQELANALKAAICKSNYITPRIAAKRYLHHTPINERYLSDAITPDDYSERMTILDAPLGTGKTEMLKQYADRCRAQGLKVLVIIPRRTLGTQAAERFGISDYQGERRDELQSARSRTICVPSLSKLVNESGDLPEYDVIIIDEPSAVLNFFTSQSHGLFNSDNAADHAFECASILKKLGGNGQKVILAEACLDPKVANLFRTGFGIPLDDVRLIQNGYRCNTAVKIWAITDDIKESPLFQSLSDVCKAKGRPGEAKNRMRDWMKQQLLREALAATTEAGLPPNGSGGGRSVLPLIIACDEKASGAESMHRFLCDFCGVADEDILRITADTKDFAQVHEFLLDPDGFIETQKPHVIIHTAAMETGFSVASPCGVALIADGKNHALTASALMQMVGRCRNPQFIHCLIDEGFRLEMTDETEWIESLITSAKYLKTKEGLTNQRFTDIHAWQHEIDGYLSTEANRQRMRLIESFPAYLDANGYNVSWLSPNDLDEIDCTLSELTGESSLITRRTAKNTRLDSETAIIDAEPISPDAIAEHRRNKTLTDEHIAGEQKSELLELSGAEWVEDDDKETRLQLKSETASLFEFVKESTFDKEKIQSFRRIESFAKTIDELAKPVRLDKPILSPTEYRIENATDWATLKKITEPTLTKPFLETRTDLDNTAWLSEAAVNNMAKQFKLHKPRNRYRFDNFKTLHSDESELRTEDLAESGGATSFRAFKHPKRKIVAYLITLTDKIAELTQGGVVWVRERDAWRIKERANIEIYAEKGCVRNLDRFIQLRLEKPSDVHEFTIRELVCSHFRSAAVMMDRGDYYSALRQILYEFFYRLNTSHNRPIAETALIGSLPKISDAFTMRKEKDFITASIPLDAWQNQTKTKTVDDALYQLNHLEIDGKTKGLLWIVKGNQFIGVPSRVYREVEIDREQEAQLLALRDAPTCQETADDTAVKAFRTRVERIVNVHAEKVQRENALARIEDAVITLKSATVQEIAYTIGLEFDDTNKKAIIRRLNSLMENGRIGRTGFTDNVTYFPMPPTNEQTGDNHPSASIDTASSQLGTKSLFLNKESPFKKSKSVPSSPESPSVQGSTEFSDEKSLPDDVRYVTSEDEIEDALNWVGDAETVGLDFETFDDGTFEINDSLYTQKAEPRLLSLSNGNRTVLFDCPKLPSLTEALRPWLEDKTIICHNAVFDMAFMDRWEIAPRKIVDTMLMESVVQAATGKSERKSLDEVCKRYLDIALDKSHQVTDWSPLNTPNLSPTMLNYAVKDAKVLVALHDALESKIHSLGMDARCYQIFCDAIPAFVSAKQVGMPMDREKTRQLWDTLQSEATQLEERLTLKYGRFGYDGAHKTAKVQRVVNQAFGIEIESTSREALAELMLETDNAELKAFCEEVLSVRRLEKIATELEKYIESAVEGGGKDSGGKGFYHRDEKSLFGHPLWSALPHQRLLVQRRADAARRLMIPNHRILCRCETAPVGRASFRIHADFRVNGAQNSGRTACSNPNLQQVSKGASVEGVLSPGAVRDCFVAPEGYRLITSDYSQIELVLNAIHCGDTTMLEAFRQGMDIHKRTASLLFDKPIEEVTKTERQIAKSANFGLQYGASVEGFQRYANSYGIALTMEEARRIREAWFSGYRDIAAHHSRVRSQKPSTVTTIAGRVLHTKTVQNALNLPIQGSGADLLNRATAIIQEKLKGFDAAIVAFVHDELVIEVRAEQAEQVAEVVQTGMREAGREFYPDDADLIRCEVQIGQSWGKGEVYTPEAEVDMDAVNGLAETLESTPAAVDENGRLTRAFFDDLTRGFMAENGAVWLKPLKAALSKTFSNMAIEDTNSEDAERQCSSAFPADCTLERWLKALAVEEGWNRSSVTVERRSALRGGGATWIWVYHEDELDVYQVEATYAEAMGITLADKVEVTYYPWTEADLRDIEDLLPVVDFKHRARDGTGGQKGTDTSEGKCHD